MIILATPLLHNPYLPGDEIYGCGRVLSGLHNNVFKFSYIGVGVKKILKH